MKGSCGQGKPYMKIELPVREYKDGGVVYTDKNDPDDKVKMKDLEVMEKKNKDKESQSWKEWEWDNISELQSVWDSSRLP